MAVTIEASGNTIAVNGKEVALKGDSAGGGAGGAGAATAWCVFNGVTGAIKASHNIKKVVKNGPGDYILHFDTPMDNANYAILPAATEYQHKLNSTVAPVVAGNCVSASPTGGGVWVPDPAAGPINKGVNSFNIVGVSTTNPNSAVFYDLCEIYVAVFGGKN